MKEAAVIVTTLLLCKMEIEMCKKLLIITYFTIWQRLLVACYLNDLTIIIPGLVTVK